MHTTELGLGRCLAFINCHMQAPKYHEKRDERSHIRCVTISRQSGSGAHTFAEELAAYLQSHQPSGSPAWTMFDRGLVEAVLQDQHLPARLAQFMPEDRVRWRNDIIEELFKLHPPTETLVRRTSQTILHLADLGHVIIVGRGGNIITASLPGMLHLRLIGSVEARVARIQEAGVLTKKETLKLIELEDAGRRRYLKQYFGKEIDDPLLYDMIINTDRIPPREAAWAIGERVLHGMPAEGRNMPKAA
jgi:cytidylate kinase